MSTGLAVSNPPAAEAASAVPAEQKPIVAAPSETKPDPTTTTKTEEPTTEAEKTDAPANAPEKTTIPPPKPLTRLSDALPAIIKESGHDEIWGVTLKDSNDVPTSIVLEKFLRANNKDFDKAKAQLTAALKWRKEMEPSKLLADTAFDTAKFGGLGYVTVYPKTENHEKEIITWNIYGAVKDLKSTFGNLKEFIQWRSALMELSVRELDLPSATVPIPENGEDPYRMVQVHDYLNVSFLRMDPVVKAASKETIEVFSLAYPELLKEKFFVNVPILMGWVFSAMKLFLSPETVKKFHPLSYGSSLAGELKGFGSEVPEVYGGKGKDIKEGLTVKYADAGPAKEAEAVKGEAAKVEA